eukprot:TRINITY_DN1132_c1_g1_i1.p1 TRINITY_DN1132_c1_g1~~TRINITY_DN1132_c1_g1_i1.p1  ORF type:complete len:397 (-),score=94.70 TRINITY_DN1132_c1_g1_i1:26-1216(-)
MKSNSNSGNASHNIFVTENGDVYSFGNNEYGQCGLESDEEYIFMPTKVMNNQKIKSISISQRNSLILEKNGNLFGCGYGSLLTLGEFKVKNFTHILSDVLRISCSEYFVVIQKFDRKIYWVGILGSSSSNHLKEIEIEDVFHFSTGYDHILFFKENGEVWAMGNNEEGQCGIKEEKKCETPVLIFKDENIEAVECGYKFSFILTRNNDGNTILKSFGNNVGGKLGIGHSNKEKKEIFTIQSFQNISSIHIGAHFSLILTDDGDVYGCGTNWDGQLCTGNTNDCNSFTKGILSGIRYIKVGFNFSFFFLENKEIFVCGEGSSGELALEDMGTKNIARKFEHCHLKLIPFIPLVWSTTEHKYFGKLFKERVFLFLLTLKILNLKLPRPIQHIIIQFSL